MEAALRAVVSSSSTGATLHVFALVELSAAAATEIVKSGVQRFVAAPMTRGGLMQAKAACAAQISELPNLQHLQQRRKIAAT